MSTDGDIFRGLTAEQAAWRLLTDFGFSVIPVQSRGKKPLGEWKKYQFELASEDQFDAWVEQYDNCNWGVITGKVSGLVVFDCDGPDAIAWAKTHLPIPCIQVATGKGVHLYYKYPEDDSFLRDFNPRTLGLQADIRKEGGFVVAPQSVHESGKTYTIRMIGDRWQDAPEFQILEPETGSGKGDLSDIDLADVRASYTTVTRGDRNNFLTAEAGRLFARGLSREAVLNDLADTNRARCQPPVSPRELAGIVNSLDKAEARNHPERREKKEQERQAKAVQTDMTGVKLLTLTDPLEQYPIDDDLLHPGGLLEEMMEYGMRASVRTHPIYCLAGAISVLGTIASQRVRSWTNLITSMYCVAVGSSGSGKDAPKKMCARLLKTCAPGAYGGSDIASDTSVLARLAMTDKDGHAISRRVCLVPDEFGKLLKQCANKNSWKNGLTKLLTETTGQYDCSYEKIYATKEKNIVIPWYGLSLMGMTVPEELYGAMQDNESTNGFLARLTIFEHTGPLCPKNYHPDDTIPPELARKLKAIWEKSGGEGHANLDSNGDLLPYQQTDPPILYPTDPAMAYYLAQDALADAQAAACDAAGRKAACSIWRRVGEKAIQLAVILCISRLGASYYAGGDLIELADMQYAWRLITRLTQRECAMIGLSIYRNDFEKLCQEIKLGIMSYQRRERQKGHTPKPGAPKAWLLKRVAVPEKLLDEAINKLIKSNDLRLVEGWKASANSRKPLTLYCLVEEQETDD